MGGIGGADDRGGGHSARREEVCCELAACVCVCGAASAPLRIGKAAGSRRRAAALSGRRATVRAPAADTHRHAAPARTAPRPRLVTSSQPQRGASRRLLHLPHRFVRPTLTLASAACLTPARRAAGEEGAGTAHARRSASLMAARPLDAFCRSSVLQAAGGCAASRRLAVWRTQARRCAHCSRAWPALPHAPPPRCRCGRMIAASDGARHPPALARPPRRHSNISAPPRPRGVSNGAARAPLRQRRRGRCSVKEVSCRDADSEAEPGSARV